MDEEIIIKPYDPILTKESDIIYKLQNPQEMDAINAIAKNLEDLANESRIKLRIEDVPTTALDVSQVELLRKHIKSQNAWKKLFSQAMDLSNIPQASRCEEAIYIPWWSESVLHVSDEKYEKGKLSLDMSLKHSYVTQLIRLGKIVDPVEKTMSIMGVVITSPCSEIVLGLRGGNSYSGTIMSVPAGSVKYHSGKNPIFESFYAELFEELGLTRKDVVSTELIGRLSGGMIKDNPHYVIRMKTNTSFSEIKDRWNSSAKDRKEHRDIFAYNPENKDLVYNSFSIQQAIQDNLPETSKANQNTILPHCTAALSLHYQNK